MSAHLVDWSQGSPGVDFSPQHNVNRPPTNLRLRMDQLDGNQISVLHAMMVANNSPTVAGDLWEPIDENSCIPMVTLEARPDGFDLLFRFVNEDDEPRSLGKINLGFFRFPCEVQSPDFRSDARQLLVPAAINACAGCGFCPTVTTQSDYPANRYAPVAVFEYETEGTDYAVGVSVL